MDPNEIVRPQEEKTVWIYTRGKNEGQVAPANHADASPVIRTTVYRRDGRVEVWQRSPGDGPNQGVLMPAPVSYTDDKIAADYQRAKEKAGADAGKPAPAAMTRNINGVPHQVTGKDENGQDVWSPVQTAAGPAQPSQAATAQTAAPGGKPFIDDGPEAGQTGRRWGWNPETRLYDRDLGPSPSAQKPDADGKPASASATAPVEGRPGWRKVTEKVVKDGKSEEVTYYLDPSGNRQETLPGENPTTATGTKPLEGHPGWQVVTRAKKDAQGNSATETVYLDPQGKETASPPAEKGERIEKPIQGKDGKQYTQVTETDPATKTQRTFYTDETGREVALPGDPDKAAPPPGMPRYTPDLTKPGGGLWDYRDQLDAWVEANPDKMTWTQRQAVMAEANTFATSVANQWNTGAALLREDYQNQTSQRNADVSTANTRASLSNQHMQNALGLVSKFLPYMGQKPGTATNLFTGLLAVQVAHATALGGLKDVPREQMHPNLRAAAERYTAGAAGQMAPPPNAIGAGAVPGAIQPGAPTPEQAGAPVPFAGELPQPSTPTQYFPTGSAPLAGANPALQRALGMAPPVQPAVFDANGMARPEDNSMRQQAMDRQQMAMAQQLLGQQGEQPFQLAPMEMPQDGGMDFGMNQPISPILDTSIPGLTPDMDMQARKELDMALSGGHW